MASSAVEAAKELLHVPSVQVMHIAGVATGESARGELNIIEAGAQDGQDVIILACGDFSYPLIGQPILRASATTFMLPAEDSTVYAVICLDDETAPVLDQALRVYCEMKDQTTGEILKPTDPTFGEKLGRGLIVGGEMLAHGLKVGATYAGRGVLAFGTFLQGKISKRETEVEVSDKTKAALTKAKAATGMAVVVSTGFVESVSAMASHLAVAIGDAIVKTDVGKKWHAKSDSNTGRQIKHVAMSGLHAFGTVWEGLEDAAGILWKDTGKASSAVVKHRYGEAAAEATTEGFHICKNTAQAGLNVRKLGTKALIRKTATGTAKHLILKPNGEAGSASSAPAIRDRAPTPAVPPRTSTAQPAAVPAPPVPPRRISSVDTT